MLQIFFFLLLTLAAFWMNHKTSGLPKNSGQDLEEIVKENQKPHASGSSLNAAFAAASKELRKENNSTAPTLENSESPPEILGIPPSLSEKIQKNEPHALSELLEFFQSVPASDTEVRAQILNLASEKVDPDNLALMQSFAIRQLESSTGDEPSAAELDNLKTAAKLYLRSSTSPVAVEEIYKQMDSVHPSAEAKSILKQVFRTDNKARVDLEN